MQIQVASLRYALALLEPVVPKKAALPVCQTILVGEGRAMANDLEVAVSLDLPAAEGPPLCFPRQALDFLAMVPGHSGASIELAADKLEISVGGQRAAFKTPSASDFPPFPSLDPEHDTFMDGDSLVMGLRAVAPYAATEESRPVLTAVCLTLSDHPRVATADGLRLAWEDLLGRLPGEGNLIIPRGAISHLSHLWKAAGGTAGAPRGSLSTIALVKRFIRLAWRDNLLHLSFGPVTMAIKLLDGTYPNYGQLIPKDFKSHVTFLAEDLDRALGAIGPVARDGAGAIRLEWEGGRLKVGARGSDGEVGQMEVPTCRYCQEPGRVAFDIRLLGDYMKGKQGMVKVSCYAESGPALIAYHGKANHVLMPMGVQWDTPSPYPPDPEKEPSPEPEPISDPVAAYVGKIGDPDGPRDDPVFSEETRVEDIEADIGPAQPISESPSADGDTAPDTQPPVRAVRVATSDSNATLGGAAKPRPGTRKAGGKAKPALEPGEGAQAGA